MSTEIKWKKTNSTQLDWDTDIPTSVARAIVRYTERQWWWYVESSGTSRGLCATLKEATHAANAEIEKIIAEQGGYDKFQENIEQAEKELDEFLEEQS